GVVDDAEESDIAWRVDVGQVLVHVQEEASRVEDINAREWPDSLLAAPGVCLLPVAEAVRDRCRRRPGTLLSHIRKDRLRVPHRSDGLEDPNVAGFSCPVFTEKHAQARVEFQLLPLS